jgi:hypothetical protein
MKLPLTVATGLALLSAVPNAAVASWIADAQVTVLGGGLAPIIIPTASGQAVTNDPGGMQIVPQPPFGANIKVTGHNNPATNTPFVISTSAVDLAKGTFSSGFVAAAGATGAGTNADINFKIIGAAPVLAATTVIEKIALSLDPQEVVDAFFGPDVKGGLAYNLSVTDLVSDTTLLNSVSSFSDSSVGTVTDNTGMLHWSQLPGLFDGLGAPGDLGGLTNVFSSKHWVLDPTMLTVSQTVTLNPGETLNSDLEALVSLSGSATSGSSIFGFSEVTVPEPSGILLLGSALLFMLAADRTRRARGIAKKQPHLISSSPTKR